MLLNSAQIWKDRFYKEQGSLARIKFDDSTETVSEGIAYGMLIMVYMSDDQNENESTSKMGAQKCASVMDCFGVCG